MTDSQIYNGVGKLGDAIAELYGCSPKNNNRIAELVAKAELGIVSKTKKLPDDVKRAIYQWHCDRMRPATNNAVEIISQADSNDGVEIFSHDDSNESVELYSQPEPSLPVDIISQPEYDKAVEINSQYADTALIRIAFYIQRQGKKRVKQARVRQVIALDGFYVNALMLATGIDKKGVPAWVQSAVNGWAAFDGELPVTRQVKLLIVRELTKHLK
ncbi:MAG: hypothetical protein NTY50_17685 [Methylobacter sp.]|nr:hypothetical protein [Methylobacter sp.]